MSKFDKHSNFDPKHNFSEVKFGYKLPVLQSELNEMQQIQKEARETLARDYIGNGVLNELTFNISGSKLTIKNDSTFYVNGKRIFVPNSAFVNVSSEGSHVLFLEVWEEEVTFEDTLNEYGGESQPTMPNPIKDFEIETTRRIVTRWRLRCNQGTVMTTIKAQGKLSAPGKVNYIASTDEYIFVGKDSTASFNGEVYAMPLFLVSKSSDNLFLTPTFRDIKTGDEVDKELKKKVEVIVTSNPPEIPERQEGAFYFKITRSQSGSGGGLPSSVRVSPNMGIEIQK